MLNVYKVINIYSFRDRILLTHQFHSHTVGLEHITNEQSKSTSIPLLLNNHVDRRRRRIEWCNAMTSIR